MSATKNKRSVQVASPPPPPVSEPTAEEILERMRANNRERARRRADKAARTLGKITMTREQRGDVDLVVAYSEESIAKAAARLLLEEAARLADPAYQPEGVLKRTKNAERVYAGHSIGFLLLDHQHNAALNYIINRTRENVAPLIRRLFTNEAKRVLAGNPVSHTHAA